MNLNGNEPVQVETIKILGLLKYITKTLHIIKGTDIGSRPILHSENNYSFKLDRKKMLIHKNIFSEWVFWIPKNAIKIDVFFKLTLVHV